jgi:hypothetical protein
MFRSFDHHQAFLNNKIMPLTVSKLLAIGLVMNVQTGKAIPITGHGEPESCETSRLPHFLDNRLTDDGEVVNLTRRPPFTPKEDSWCSFLLEAESTPWP